MATATEGPVDVEIRLEDGQRAEGQAAATSRPHAAGGPQRRRRPSSSSSRSTASACSSPSRRCMRQAARTCRPCPTFGPGPRRERASTPRDPGDRQGCDPRGGARAYLNLAKIYHPDRYATAELPARCATTWPPWRAGSMPPTTPWRATQKRPRRRSRCSASRARVEGGGGRPVVRGERSQQAAPSASSACRGAADPLPPQFRQISGRILVLLRHLRTNAMADKTSMKSAKVAKKAAAKRVVRRRPNRARRRRSRSRQGREAGAPLRRQPADREGRRRRPRAGLHRGHAGLETRRRAPPRRAHRAHRPRRAQSRQMELALLRHRGPGEETAGSSAFIASRST